MKNKKNNLNAGILMISSIFLILALLLSNLVVNQTFEVGGETILYSVFIYPFVFFFANKITKEFGPSKTLAVLFVAIIVQCLTYYLLNDLLKDPITSNVLIASIAAFGISQIINTLAYTNFNKNTKFVSIFKIYFLSLLADGIVFTYIITNDFTIGFVYALAFRLFIALGLSYLEHKKC